LNTKIRDEAGSFPRSLGLKGLNGSGIVVTMADTDLDYNSKFLPI
jgi:hypothetical protein